VGDFVTEKIISEKSARIPLLWKIILFVQIVVWIPLPFLGFDSHHDGLILTTVHMLREAILNGGAWPFNQYGPFWAMPFVLGTIAFPSEWTFTIIRIMTVGFYLLTGLLVYKCAKIISTVKIAFISVLIFFLSQPFLTDYGSALVPWPSAVIMPIFMTATLLFLKLHLKEIIPTQRKYFSSIIGILISGIFFSRAQIGFLLLIVALLILFFNKQINALVFLIIGFLSSTLLIAIFLNYHGWLSDALSDEFIFGSLYLRGDTSTYPIPIFTFIGVSAFLFILNFGGKITKTIEMKYSLKFIAILFFGLLISILFVFYAILDSRGIDFLPMLVTISRRFWVSYFLAVIAYSFFKQLKETYNAYISRNIQGSKLQMRNSLVLLSVVGELQVYPLFDQMHFWWGSVPAVILIIIVTKERLVDEIFPSEIRSRLVTISLVAATALGVIPLAGQISNTYSQYPKEISNSLWVSPSAALDAKKLQEFFHLNIEKGSSVLNLCANADIFFVRDRFYSSSRIFVLWPNITEIKKMRQSLEGSNPDFVVTCSLSRIQSFQKSSELVQKQILQKALTNPLEVAVLKSSPELIWRIWKSIPS
jgi:hypothetical protein